MRSVFDRTLFVLGRAVSFAAPAGLLIWFLANIEIKDISLLMYCTNFLDPFAKMLGMDGVILMAFILGLPANEIVIPIMIMAYMAKGNLMDIQNISLLKEIFIENGWTYITAVSTILFALMHWPCSTTLLTLKKEMGSLKWTLLAFLIPTMSGVCICFLFTEICRFFAC